MRHIPWYFHIQTYQQEWCQLCIIIYHISIKIPHNLRQLYFSPPPPLMTEYVTTDRVQCSLGSGGHEKSYDCVEPWFPNKYYMTRMMYPASADLSENHQSSRDASLMSPPPASNKAPPSPTSENHFSGHQKLVSSKMSFPIYYYFLLLIS